MSIEPVIAQYDGPIHALTKWAVNKRDDVPPEPFASWIADLVPEVYRDRLGYYTGCITPNTPLDGDWCRGYPHCHVKSVDWEPDTLTVITYLTVAEEGGEFGLGGLKETDPYTFMVPKPGLSIMLDAVRWHGARPVIRGTRISLMASACSS